MVSHEKKNQCNCLLVGLGFAVWFVCLVQVAGYTKG